MPAPATTDPGRLARMLGPRDRLLGLDLGDRTLGVALADLELCTATPLTVIARARFAQDVDALAALVEEWGAAALVVGLPVNMDGSEGARAQVTRGTVGQLRRALAERAPPWAGPVLLWDERLSTVAVERHLIDTADLSRRRRAAVVDKLAAVHILQGAVDAVARLQRQATQVAEDAPDPGPVPPPPAPARD